MGPYFADAGAFLVETLFGLYILAVLLRLLLQMVRADFYNPISQFLVAATNPPLLPLRRIIPGFMGIDMAAVVLLLLLSVIKLTILNWINNVPIHVLPLLFMAAVELLQMTVTVFLVCILIRVILSWLNPYPSAASQLLVRLTEPLLRPARRLLPPFSGVDLSPMLVMIGLVLVQMLLIRPLLHLGMALGS